MHTFTPLLSSCSSNSQPSNLVVLPSTTVYAGHGQVYTTSGKSCRPMMNSPPGKRRPHEGPVNAMCRVEADPFNSFLSGGVDGAVNKWSQENAAGGGHGQWNVAQIVDVEGAVTCLSSAYVSSGSNRVLVTVVGMAAPGALVIVSPASGPSRRQTLEPALMIESACLHPMPNHTLLCIAAAVPRNNRIHVYYLPSSPSSTFLKAGSLGGHQDWVRCFAFSPPPSAGRDTMASGSHDHKIRVWSFSSLPSSSPSPPSSVCKGTDVGRGDDGGDDAVDDLLAGSSRLSYGGLEWGVAVSFDALLVGHEESVTSLSFGRRGGLLLSSSMDRTLIVWSQERGGGRWSPMSRVGAAGGIVGGSVGNSLLGFVAAAFTWDGDGVVAQGYGGSVHLWDVDGSSEGVSPPLGMKFVEGTGVTGHFKPVNCVDWAPCGSYLLSCSEDHTTRMWAPTSSEDRWLEVGRPQVHGYGVTALCCIGTGAEMRHRFISGADEKQLRVFDAPKSTLRLLNKLTPYSSSPEDDEESRVERAFLPSLGLSNKGNEADALEEGGEDDDATATNQSSAPSERDLGVTTLWPETRKLYGHDSEILSIASTAKSLSRSTRNIIIASSCKARGVKNAALRLWRVDLGVCVKVLDGGHRSSVTCLDFDPSGKILISSGKDRRICVWSIDSEGPDSVSNESALQSALDGAHKRILWGLSFCNVEVPTFISGSRDMTLKVWQINADFTLSNLYSVKLQASVTACSFALPPNPQICAVGLEDGGLKVLKFGDGFASHEELLDIEGGHVATVKKLAWRPGVEEMVLASCGLDHAVKVYRIE